MKSHRHEHEEPTMMCPKTTHPDTHMFSESPHMCMRNTHTHRADRHFISLCFTTSWLVSGDKGHFLSTENLSASKHLTFHLWVTTKPKALRSSGAGDCCALLTSGSTSGTFSPAMSTFLVVAPGAASANSSSSSKRSFFLPVYSCFFSNFPAHRFLHLLKALFVIYSRKFVTCCEANVDFFSLQAQSSFATKGSPAQSGRKVK